MNICLTSLNKQTYSETFIKAQIDNLPVNLVFHSGRKPRLYDDNTPIVAPIFSIIERILNRFLKNKTSFISDWCYIRLLKKRKIDVVLAQYGIGGVHILSICQKANIPLVVHFHGFDASEKPILKEYETAYQNLFKEAVAIISVSQKMTESLVALGCDTTKIFQATYGPNDSFLKLTPQYKTQIFLAVGRFVDKKAHYLTILAFQEVLKQLPDAQLLMAGDGELLNTCRNIVKSNGLSKSIHFVGVLEPHQVQAYMVNALAFVQHSIVADSGDSEGSPVVILEAQAAGLPVISTFHAGIPEVVIDGETGFLVQEGDIKGMAEAMIKIGNDPKLAKTMGAKAKERIKNHFTMQIYTDKLMKVLEYGIAVK